MNGWLHAPAALPPEQDPRTHWIGGSVDLRAGTDVSEKRNVFNQAVWFRRLLYSVTRGRLFSQINTRLPDVISLHWVTFTVKTLWGWNVDSFVQVSAFRFWRIWISSGPSDFLIDSLGDFWVFPREFWISAFKLCTIPSFRTLVLSSWLHRASNNVETFSLPTDAHNVKKHRVIKTF